MSNPRQTSNLLGNSAPSSLRPNSINLSSAALLALLDKLDEPEAKNASRTKRSFVRRAFRKLSIRVGIVHPGGNTVDIRVAGRNLSNGGISVLHSSFVHTGSECIVYMPHPTLGEVQVRGRIVRCMHRAGVIHELGISFLRPVNAKEYLEPDPLSNNFSLERVLPADLQGRVLMIEPIKNEREIFAHYVRETGLQMAFAATLADGLRACHNFVAAVISYDLPDAEPSEAATKLRDSGHAGPILMIVPDDSARVRARVASAPVRAFLARPLTQELALRAMAEILLVEESAATTNSATGAKVKNAPDDELTRLGKSIFAAVFRRDVAAVRAACLRIRALAEARSWTLMVQLVNEVQVRLDQGGTLDSVMTQLEMVIAACEPSFDPGTQSDTSRAA